MRSKVQGAHAPRILECAPGLQPLRLDAAQREDGHVVGRDALEGVQEGRLAGAGETAIQMSELAYDKKKCPGLFCEQGYFVNSRSQGSKMNTNDRERVMIMKRGVSPMPDVIASVSVTRKAGRYR